MKLCALKVVEVQALPVVVVPLLPFLGVVTALAHRCFAMSARLTATCIILYIGLTYVLFFLSILNTDHH